MTIAIDSKTVAALWAHFGEPRDFIIVDARGDHPLVAAVHIRGWLEDGFVVVPVSAERIGDPADAGDCCDLAAAPNVPLVLLRASHTGPDGYQTQSGRFATNLIQICTQQLGDRFAALEALSATGEARLAWQGAQGPQQGNLPRVALPWQVRRQDVIARIAGDNELILPKPTAPWTVHVDTTRCTDTASFFTIEVTDGQGHTIGETYTCPPASEGRVVVSVVPGLNGDQISATWDASDGSPSRVLDASAAIPRREGAAIDDLAVVFDRTCPDDAHWLDARALVMGLRSSTPTGFGGEETAPPRPATFNRNIRSGLVSALRHALDGGAVGRVFLWWTADTEDEGMGAFVDGLELPQMNCGGGESAIDGDACARFFETTGYAPGLDLVDPVDEALSAALDGIRRHAGGRRRAILIVGNSPPRAPAPSLRPSPLDELHYAPGLRRQVRCASRYQASVWEEALEACRHEGIEVHYLFLKHSNFGALAETRAATGYKQIEIRVENVLRATVSLSNCKADEADLAQAAQSAINLLVRRTNSVNRTVVTLAA